MSFWWKKWREVSGERNIGEVVSRGKGGTPSRRCPFSLRRGEKQRLQEDLQCHSELQPGWEKILAAASKSAIVDVSGRGWNYLKELFPVFLTSGSTQCTEPSSILIVNQHWTRFKFAIFQHLRRVFGTLVLLIIITEVKIYKHPSL